MKKISKAIIIIILFLTVIPGLAGLAISVLWNSILTEACGFAAIGFWQGVGVFLLGQLASCGFVLGIMTLGAIFRHHGSMAHHWQNLSEEEKKEFFNRRRSFFGRKHRPLDADEL